MAAKGSLKKSREAITLGTITIEDGVMLGPEVGLFTVNHEPKNIRTVMTKEIHIKKNAWIGARVSILPGVTIGENAGIGGRIRQYCCGRSMLVGDLSCGDIHPARSTGFQWEKGISRDDA